MLLMEILFATRHLTASCDILTSSMNTSSSQTTSMFRWCSTDTTVDLQHRMARMQACTLAEEVDELHTALTSPEIYLFVSRWSKL